MKVKENGETPIFIPNLRKDMYGRLFFLLIFHAILSGFFVFHFGSSIGTHHIEIRNEENGVKIFPVVAI